MMEAIKESLMSERFKEVLNNDMKEGVLVKVLKGRQNNTESESKTSQFGLFVGKDEVNSIEAYVRLILEKNMTNNVKRVLNTVLNEPNQNKETVESAVCAPVTSCLNTDTKKLIFADDLILDMLKIKNIENMPNLSEEKHYGITYSPAFTNNDNDKYEDAELLAGGFAIFNEKSEGGYGLNLSEIEIVDVEIRECVEGFEIIISYTSNLDFNFDGEYVKVFIDKSFNL